MIRPLGNRRRMKRASALLAALVAARFAFVFIHFSRVPHFFNPHSGHVEGLRGHGGPHENGCDGDGHGHQQHMVHGKRLVDLSPARQGPRVEDHRRGHLYHAHHCQFENFFTERYSHEPVIGSGVAPQLLVGHGAHRSAGFEGEVRLLLLLAPKNSPPSIS